MSMSRSPPPAIDAAGIKARFDAVAPYLDERDRRLLAASEAQAAGRGGIAAVARATGIARSTIGRGLIELRGGREVPKAAFAARAAGANWRLRRSQGCWRRLRTSCNRPFAVIRKLHYC